MRIGSKGPKVQYWLVILIPILILSMAKLEVGVGLKGTIEVWLEAAFEAAEVN